MTTHLLLVYGMLASSLDLILAGVLECSYKVEIYSDVTKLLFEQMLA